MMRRVTVAQPSGTVTLVFTDIERSTRLLEQLGTDAYRDALAEHRRIVREACARHQGYEVDCEGDAFFIAFHTVEAAVAAVSEAMRGLEGGPIRIRVGIHTGEPRLDGPKYVGMDIHRAARIMASAHGGQVLVSGSTAALVGAGLRDLGYHRLKDLPAPERLYQLGAGEHPPPRSLYHPSLPVPATPFIGRRHEVTTLVELLTDSSTRLLTLTGPGGTGKTRLALEAVSHTSEQFPDGLHWVPLAGVREPSLVPSSLAQALEVPEISNTSPIDAIVRAFSPRRALVLLDNCEHLLDAAAASVSALVGGCDRLVVACTSRERLGLRAERIVTVEPMEASDAETLFVARASQIRADFVPDEHVADICRAIDGLPLAVELAAARVRSLSTQSILERLSERISVLATRDRDVEERQRTLEATIAWSYDLLAPEEQRALRALSVFAGGCTLDAAEQVAGADLELVESLLDKSLLRHRVDPSGDDRYWMLETIREFATRALERDNDLDLVRDRHLAWVLEFVRAVAPRWADPAGQTRVDPVQAEEANIRLALATSIDTATANAALELVGLIGQTWAEGGHFVELQSWAQRALALEGDPYLEGMALISLGMADWSGGVARFEAAAERLRTAGRPREAAYATMARGASVSEVSVDRGVALLEQALAEFEDLGDEYCVSITRANLGAARGMRWPLDPEEARQLADAARDAAADARRRGLLTDEIASYEELSHALLAAGEPDEARSVALHAVQLLRERRMGWLPMPRIVVTLARCAALRGDGRQALVLAGAVRSASSELGQTLAPPRAAALQAAEHEARESLDEQAAAHATAEGEAMTVEDILDYLGTREAAPPARARTERPR
jgi:predicted ATPase/class 3 adenylate cyclase